MKVITIVNCKGGVGKTTTTLCLGSILQDKSYKVLYIDTDAQSNLTECLGGSTNTSVNNIYTLYNNWHLDIKDTIQHLDNNVDLIGASDLIDTIDLSKRKNINNYLKDRLSVLKKDYDFVLIDTPPHINYLYANVLMASDYIIITSKADIFSYRGVERTLDNIEEVKKDNKELRVSGVLLTQYNRRSGLDNAIRDNLRTMLKQYNTKVFNTYIRQNKALSVNQVFKTPVIKQKSINGYKDYLRFTEELLKEIKRG